MPNGLRNIDVDCDPREIAPEDGARFAPPLAPHHGFQ
jgi:hypothetical protein